MERQEAAAALAILDLPWCHVELSEVLAESTDQVLTSECRAALSASRDLSIKEIATRWEAANPHEPETEPHISFGEMQLRDRHIWMQHEMAELHDRVIRLRDRWPPAK